MHCGIYTQSRSPDIIYKFLFIRHNKQINQVLLFCRRCFSKCVRIVLEQPLDLVGLFLEVSCLDSDDSGDFTSDGHRTTALP